MPYNAKVYRVLIASPGDVSAERAVARDVIHEWNAIHSESRSIVLQPIGWDTHSAPDMGAHPQDLINKQIVSKSDLVIGIFWTRIGTPTNDFPSGTVEEIQQHISVNKPTMLYFSQKPVVPDNLDSDQYSDLMKFKSECEKNGLYHTYVEISDFRENFSRQLQIQLNSNDYFHLENTEKNDEFDLHWLPVSNRPVLSSDAKELLKEACRDSNGIIVKTRTFSGTAIQTNGINFIRSDSRREVAKWEAALESLVDMQLIREAGHKGEIFEVTDQGFKSADSL